MVSIESSSFCKNSFSKTICAPKTASVSSLDCALSLRSTKSTSSDHVAAVRRRVREARPRGGGAAFRLHCSTQGVVCLREMLSISQS
jgi:hypothetical protein